MQPLVNLAVSNEEERQKFKRNTVDVTQSLLGVGVTSLAGYYTFKKQNADLNFFNKLTNVNNKTLSNFSQENDSIKTISRNIKELVLSKEKENLEAKAKNNLSTLSILNNTSLTEDAKYQELLKLNGKEKVAHLSTMMSMINDPNLGVEDLQKNFISKNLKSAIQKNAKDLTNEEELAIKNVMKGYSAYSSVELDEKYASLYNYNLNLEKNNLLFKLNNSTEPIQNTFDTINKSTKTVGKANEHIVKSFNKLNDVFDFIDSSPLLNPKTPQSKKINSRKNNKQKVTANSSKTETSLKDQYKRQVKSRYERLSRIFNKASGFDVEISTINEPDKSPSFYAKITRNSGGASIEPIVMPLALSKEGQFGRKTKYARMNASMSSSSLAPAYVLDLSSVKKIVDDQTLNQTQKKRAIQDLMKSNQYEDALLDILEKTYDKDSLKSMNQHARNELMEVFRGMTSDINQAMSLEKTEGWYTSRKQKGSSQINSNKVIFTFDTKTTSAADIEQLIPKLTEMQLGFQGLSGSGAGIKKYSVNSKEIGVRMAYAAMNEADEKTVTPYNILRPLGVSNELVTPGASRPGQLFDKPEAFLGFIPKGNTDVEYNSNKETGFFKDIKVLGTQGSELLNIGSRNEIGKDLSIVGSNTGFIVHFSETNKKGQALGLADAMSYAGGEMVVAKSIKKNIKYRSDMKELAIYNSEEFQKLLAGDVVELEGEKLNNFFKTYADDQGRLIIGESDTGPDFIYRTSSMRKLKLAISKNVDKGSTKELQLVGEIIGSEQGSKIFSEAMKGVQFGVEGILDEAGFQRIINRAGGDADFMSLVKKNFGAETSNIVMTGQDILTKAPSYLSSFMFGGLRGLGFTENMLMDEVFNPSKYTSDILNPEDTTEVKGYQRKYLQQTSRNILNFLLDSKTNTKIDSRLNAQVTNETIGAILTSSQVLDAFKDNKKDAGYLEQLLNESEISSKLTAAGLSKEEILKRANTGFGFGYISTFAGTPSSEYKSKLARIEPRVATYMMGAMKSLFQMEDKEIGQFLGNMISNVEGAADKINLMPTLLMSSKSFNPSESADAQTAEINQMLKTGKLFNASREFAQAFMGANLESSPDALIKFFQSELYKTSIVGEQDAFGAVFNIEDLFRNADDTIDEEGLRLLRNRIGGKDQIVLPMQKALEIVSGVELKREGEDFKIAGEFYRNINDAMHAFQQARLSKNANAKSTLIDAGLSSFSTVQETTGKIMRNLFSGRIKGSATLEGKGIRLGSDVRSTVFNSSEEITERMLKGFNKALTSSSGYGVFMDTQAFMNTIASLTEEEKIYQTKKFMFGMQNIDFKLDTVTGNVITTEAAAPEGIRASAFRNPFLGPTHMAIMSNVFRYDNEVLDDNKSLISVLGSNGYQDSKGLSSLTGLLKNPEIKEQLEKLGNKEINEVLDASKASKGMKFEHLGVLYKLLQGDNREILKGIDTKLTTSVDEKITNINDLVTQIQGKINKLGDKTNIDKTVRGYNSMLLGKAKKEQIIKTNKQSITEIDAKIASLKSEIDVINKNPNEKTFYDKNTKVQKTETRYQFINNFIERMKANSDKSKFEQDKLLNKRLKSEFNLFLKHKDEMLKSDSSLKLNYTKDAGLDETQNKTNFHTVFEEFKKDYLSSSENRQKYNTAFENINNKLYQDRAAINQDKIDQNINKKYQRRILQKHASYVDKKRTGLEQQLAELAASSKEMRLYGDQGNLTTKEIEARNAYVGKQKAQFLRISDLFNTANAEYDFKGLITHLQTKDSTRKGKKVIDLVKDSQTKISHLITNIFKTPNDKGVFDIKDDTVKGFQNYDITFDDVTKYQIDQLNENDRALVNAEFKQLDPNTNKLTDKEFKFKLNDLYDFYKNDAANKRFKFNNLTYNEAEDIFNKNQQSIFESLSTDIDNYVNDNKLFFYKEELEELENLKQNKSQYVRRFNEIFYEIEKGSVLNQREVDDIVKSSLFIDKDFDILNKQEKNELNKMYKIYNENHYNFHIKEISNKNDHNLVKQMLQEIETKQMEPQVVDNRAKGLFLSALQETANTNDGDVQGPRAKLFNLGLKVREQLKIFDFQDNNLFGKEYKRQIEYAKKRETNLKTKLQSLLSKFGNQKLTIPQELGTPDSKITNLINEVPGKMSYFLQGIKESLYKDGKKPTDLASLSDLFLSINKQFADIVKSDSGNIAKLDIDIGKALTDPKTLNKDFANSDAGKAVLKLLDENKEIIKKGKRTDEEKEKFKSFKKEVKKLTVSYQEEIVAQDIEQLKKMRFLSSIDGDKVQLRAQQFLEYKALTKQLGELSEKETSNLNAINDFLNNTLKSNQTKKEKTKAANDIYNNLSETEKDQLNKKLIDLKRYTDNKDVVDSFLDSKVFDKSSLNPIFQEQTSNQIYGATSIYRDQIRKQESFNRFETANKLIEELKSKQTAFEAETDNTQKTALQGEIDSLKTKVNEELYELNNNQLTKEEKEKLATQLNNQYEEKVNKRISNFEIKTPKRDALGNVILDKNTNKPEMETKTGFNSLDEIEKFRNDLIKQDIEREVKRKQEKINKLEASKAKKQEKINKYNQKISDLDTKINDLKTKMGMGGKNTYTVTDKTDPTKTIEYPTIKSSIYGDTGSMPTEQNVEKVIGYGDKRATQEQADLINYKYLKGKAQTKGLSTLSKSEKEEYKRLNAVDSIKKNKPNLDKVESLEELHKNKLEMQGGDAFDFEKHQIKQGETLFSSDNQIKGQVPQLEISRNDFDKAQASTKEGTLGARKQKYEQKIESLEESKQKLEEKKARILADTETLDVKLEKSLNTTLGEYISNYSRMVGSGSGQIVFPEFESEFAFKDLKGNDIKDFSIKVRTDLSRAMVGDFDADIYQAIIHDKNTVEQFGQKFSGEGLGNFQRQAATFTLNMEMIKHGMDQFGKRLNESTGQILDYKTFRGSETQKEQILKGTVGGVDTTMKSAVAGAMYTMMNSKDDFTKMRKTHLAAQTLIAAAQEIVVIKSKSLEQATDVGNRYKASIDEAFKTGNTQKFRDFLMKDLFAGTKFEEGFEVSDVTTRDVSDELAGIHKQSLMREPIRFDINQIMEGFEEIVSTTRKIGLDKLASDKMYGHVMSSTQNINAETFNNLANRMWMLESAVASEQLDDDQFSRLFNQISGLEGSNQIENAFTSKAIKSAYSTLSNTRLAAAATAALGASYLMSSDYSRDTLDLEETFSDNKVNQKIAKQSLYEGYNRDTSMPASAMERPFYKDMVNRVQSPGDTYIAKQQSFLMKGQVSNLQDANYLNNMVLSNGGTSSMMVNDNRMPLTGNYIDRIMGE